MLLKLGIGVVGVVGRVDVCVVETGGIRYLAGVWVGRSEGLIGAVCRCGVLPPMPDIWLWRVGSLYHRMRRIASIVVLLVLRLKGLSLFIAIRRVRRGLTVGVNRLGVAMCIEQLVRVMRLHPVCRLDVLICRRGHERRREMQAMVDREGRRSRGKASGWSSAKGCKGSQTDNGSGLGKGVRRWR